MCMVAGKSGVERPMTNLSPFFLSPQIRSPPGGHGGKNIQGKDTGSNERNSISCSQSPVHKLFRIIPVSVYIFF